MKFLVLGCVCFQLIYGLISYSDSFAIISESDQPAPMTINVAEWRGVGNAVAIAPRWLLTAQHIVGFGLVPGVSGLTLNGEFFLTTEYVYCPLTYPDIIGTCDLALIKVDHDLPGYHPLRRSAIPQNTRAFMAGFGYRRGSPISFGSFNGFTLGTRGTLNWGYNMITTAPDSVYDGTIAMNFDRPGTSGWTVGEATVANTDSGSPIFVQNANGRWETAGIIVSGGSSVPSGGPQGVYYTMAGLGAVRLQRAPVLNWIDSKLAQGPLCDADVDQNGLISNDDIFSFLTAYFSQQPIADSTRDGRYSVDDVFRFLTKWFGGCSY